VHTRNGVKGNLKKGMTFQARFILTKRSLFQLLYDKADDWMNPARKTT
jgi:HlyD family secretion protein